MRSTLLKNIKGLLKENEAKALKRLGQNFLINQSVLEKIVRAAELKPDETVLEIGPGTGVLTEKLAQETKKVIAIEKDPKMCLILKKTLKNFKNVKIVQKDILKMKEEDLPKKFKVIANLPYYITSPVIRKLLELKKQPESMVLMIQKEVAQRICSKPPDMNLLAASVQFYAEPKIIAFVSKNNFWPSPKVDSAILKIKPHQPRAKNADNFFKIVRAGFLQPRKQLVNNFSKKLELDKLKIKNWMEKNNLNPSQRAETLTIKDWKNLSKGF